MNLTVKRIAGLAWRMAAGAGALAASGLLASCGGSSAPVTAFVATRIVVFGDESSVITNEGRKYTVNALVAGSSSVVDCAANPLWIQSLAARFGLAFPQCPGMTVDPQSRIYATPGATVADLGAQIDQYLGNGGFARGDMATVLVGANDVVGQFTQYPSVGEPQLQAAVDAAGQMLAAQVNRLADMGVKVLVSTIPNVGLAPYAGDRSVGSTNGNPAILSRLSARFNDAMLSKLTNDGRRIGLIQLDEYLASLDRARQLGLGTYANTTDASCTVALPQCTSLTQVAEVIDPLLPKSRLWADDLHVGPAGQSGLASLALARAANNPF